MKRENSMSEKVTTFIDKYQLSASNVDTQQIIDLFLSQMELGLTSSSDSSLAMLPSYINVNRDILLNKPVIVLDAGGTNLRVCTVYFDDNLQPVIKDFANYLMPGIEKELSKVQFYELLIEYISPVIHVSDQISFCFSYTTEINEHDGKLLHWSKEISIPELVGEYIGQGLLDALEKKGILNKRVTLLNDTVSTLVAGKIFGEPRKCSSYIGFILGTGINTAYIEQNVKINKVNLERGSQIINVESGGFDKFSISKPELDFDSTTKDPNAYLLEKLTSGRYFGEAVSYVLQQAYKDGVLSHDLTQSNNFPLQTYELSDFMDSPHQKPIFLDLTLSEECLSNAYLIIQQMIQRGAKLSAINVASTVLKTNQQIQAGDSPLEPICINIDGSTFYKLARFKEYFRQYLNEILVKKSIHYRICHVENSPIVGSAIAVLATDSV
jgi:hexokinase